MKCYHCNGIMSYETFYSHEGIFSGWRCISLVQEGDVGANTNYFQGSWQSLFAFAPTSRSITSRSTVYTISETASDLAYHDEGSCIRKINLSPFLLSSLKHILHLASLVSFFPSRHYDHNKDICSAL